MLRTAGRKVPPPLVPGGHDAATKAPCAAAAMAKLLAGGRTWDVLHANQGQSLSYPDRAS
eukprot:3926590-Prymnesium_polylepis.1